METIAQSPTKTVRAIVARGRTVDAPHPTEKIGRLNADGEAVIVAAVKTYGPGEEIELSAADAAWLRSTGHLVDPSQAAPNYGPGPSFNRDGTAPVTGGVVGPQGPTYRG